MIPYGIRRKRTSFQFSCFSSAVKLPGFKNYINFLGTHNILESLCHPLASSSPSDVLLGLLNVSVPELAPSALCVT